MALGQYVIGVGVLFFSLSLLFNLEEKIGIDFFSPLEYFCYAARCVFMGLGGFIKEPLIWCYAESGMLIKSI